MSGVILSQMVSGNSERETMRPAIICFGEISRAGGDAVEAVKILSGRDQHSQD